MTKPFSLNIADIPFSRFGSYFAFSYNAKEQQLLFRDVHGGDEAPSTLFVMELVKGEHAVEYDIDATETKLRIVHRQQESEYVEICISDENIVRFKMNGVALKLTAVKTRYDSFMPYKENKWEYIVYSKEIRLMISLLQGSMDIIAPWKMVGNEKIELLFNENEQQCEFAVESYKTVWTPKEYDSYEEAYERVASHYEQWLTQMPKAAEKYVASRNLASYITWSCVVHPEGLLKDYAMYMSKNWMFNIWSWDNCFNAMMLSGNQPELAMAQLDLFTQYQDPSGIYADFINDKFISFNCCKPPIHAWAFKKMRGMNEWFNQQEVVSRMYDSLVGSTNFWVQHRRHDDQTLPVYTHGNDSGWDNASIFHDGMPVEAPDLTAHLIRQMDILAEMATELQREDEAVQWKKQADKLYALLIDRLYADGRFVARYAPENRVITNQDSLILMLPIVIGYRLPREVTDVLVQSLAERFEATYGLATESSLSPLYKENGYWLGPIWAPVTYLFIDALEHNGYNEMASRIAEKFMNMTLIGGMAENFDPFSGKGLVDPAFTWTSSVFLLLAEQYLAASEAR
ncbi:hypothetical protein NV379_15060 [Paenibacillus sp. N1-5-1-14]|uniref:amylo-alpha-1,6-glucosidase n=1 Tax=Paenibacillus radicibacter TaxID=2972488 RepID=UPI002158EA15|nr:trehalase family glycosidase [Paenibacillus radicibacter]MCR8643970.1 hypothetical protein [Paenibacillus radicibacter]